MNFKLKALVAAVALAGVVGQASAANGATDAIFYIWDNTSSTSYMYDLGAFNPTTSVINPLDVTTGADWTSFVTSAGANLASDQWGVFMNFDGSRIGSTVHLGGSTAATNPTSANTQTTNLAIAAGLNAAGVTHFGIGGGADNVLTSFVLSGGNSTYLGNLWNAGNAQGAVNVAFDSAIAGGRGVPSVLTTYTPTNGNAFAFNGDLLQYNVAAVAAVPEPETYGMLAAGLLMLGAVARRRRA
jgi:hypothetical protein